MTLTAAADIDTPYFTISPYMDLVYLTTFHFDRPTLAISVKSNGFYLGVLTRRDRFDSAI